MIGSKHTPEKGVILLVDDEPSLLVALELLLEEEGYWVVTAQHGRQALDRLGETIPDLIITDYMMPYLNGAELIEAVRAQPAWAHIPILLMSVALPRGVHPEELADAYLPKAFDLEQLYATVERLIARSPNPSARRSVRGRGPPRETNRGRGGQGV